MTPQEIARKKFGCKKLNENVVQCAHIDDCKCDNYALGYKDAASQLSEANKEIEELKDHLASLQTHSKYQQQEIERLKEAIEYYYDVLREVRGHEWHYKPDHVMQKLFSAHEPIERKL